MVLIFNLFICSGTVSLARSVLPATSPTGGYDIFPLFPVSICFLFILFPLFHIACMSCLPYPVRWHGIALSTAVLTAYLKT